MATYASVEDVRVALGNLGNRLPATIDLDGHLGMAHAVVVDKLTDAYPGEIPTFTGPGLDVVRWAEARIAAADILDILRASTTTDSPVAETLRQTAYDTLDRGVPGFRPGGPTTTPGTTPMPARPRVSHVATTTVFADPYTPAVDYTLPPADGLTYVLTSAGWVLASA